MRAYVYAQCESCRKALRFLREQGIAVEEVPVRETPPTRAELSTMLRFVGGDVRRLFNTSGRDYREQNLGERLRALTTEDALTLLATNGNLVKRPFLIGAGSGLVGFRPEEWDRWARGGVR